MRPTDPNAVGTRLLFENERVRVWALEVPPGGSWGPHEHGSAYVTVVAEGSEIASVMADGHVEVAFDAQVDHVDWHEQPSERRVHTLENRGDRRYKNFIVELLDR
ncbi:MAG: hypothetical protein ACRDF7_00140 [Candidatus Limnocylindrales bacterium]